MKTGTCGSEVCERNLNNIFNKTTNRATFEMLHGYLPRFNDRIFRKVADVDVEELRVSKIMQEEAGKEIGRQQQKVKDNYD